MEVNGALSRITQSEGKQNEKDVLPIDIRNAGAQVDVLFDEHHGIFDLLINGPFCFLPVKENSVRIPFENRHLDKSIREQRIDIASAS